MISRIAFRNLFRQQRRSTITLMTMALGFTLCSLSVGTADGTYSYVIDLFTRNRTGHVQIHRARYLDRPTIYETIDDVAGVGAVISGAAGVVSWAPRVYGSALASAGARTSGARLIGVDPARERATTRLARRLTSGAFLRSENSGGILLGAGMARLLKAALGDEVALISQAADGSIANDLFTVAGIVGEPDDDGERMTVYVGLLALQQFLSIEGRIHEIAVILDDVDRSRGAADEIRKALGDSSLAVRPWQEVEAAFFHAMEVDMQGMWISLGIIMGIVSIGVLNAVLMSLLERTSEFGVLRALGTRPGAVFRLMVLETFYLTLLSVLVGGVLSLAGNWLLATYGIEYPSPIEYGGMVVDRVLGKVSWRIFWIPAAVTVGTAVLVSLLPASRAARITPVRAMRAT